MDENIEGSARAAEFLLEMADRLSVDDAWHLRQMLAGLERESPTLSEAVARMLLIKGVRLHSDSALAEVTEMVANGEFGPPAEDPTRRPTL